MDDTTGQSSFFETPEEFRALLLAEEVMYATAVDGVYHKSQAYEDVVRGIERYVASTRVAPQAKRRWFGPVMPRTEFLSTDYVRSFPDLVGSIDIFTGGDAEHRQLLAALDEGEDWTAHLSPS